MANLEDGFNPDSGLVILEKPSLRIGPEMTLSEFLAADWARGATDCGVDLGRRRWSLAGEYLFMSVESGVDLYFEADRLASIVLDFYMEVGAAPGFLGIGEQRSFAWGTLHIGCDFPQEKVWITIEYSAGPVTAGQQAAKPISTTASSAPPPTTTPSAEPPGQPAGQKDPEAQSDLDINPEDGVVIFKQPSVRIGPALTLSEFLAADWARGASENKAETGEGRSWTLAGEFQVTSGRCEVILAFWRERLVEIQLFNHDFRLDGSGSFIAFTEGSYAWGKITNRWGGHMDGEMITIEYHAPRHGGRVAAGQQAKKPVSTTANEAPSLTEAQSFESSSHLNKQYPFLIAGKRYRVIRQFVAFEKCVQGPGEEWIFLGCEFHPNDNGYSFFVSTDGLGRRQFRLSASVEEQAEILAHLATYVSEIGPATSAAENAPSSTTTLSAEPPREPAALDSPRVQTHPGINPYDGVLTFDKPSLRIGPALTFSEFLAADWAKGATDGGVSLGRHRWSLPGEYLFMSAHCGVDLYFEDERLAQIDVGGCESVFVAGAPDIWLSKFLGEQRSFAWGRVGSNWFWLADLQDVKVMLVKVEYGANLPGPPVTARQQATKPISSTANVAPPAAAQSSESHRKAAIGAIVKSVTASVRAQSYRKAVIGAIVNSVTDWIEASSERLGKQYQFLVAGRRYRVIRQIIDYDRRLHFPGEEWIFLGYLSHTREEVHSLFVSQDGRSQREIRLRGLAAEQADILGDLAAYVSELAPATMTVDKAFTATVARSFESYDVAAAGGARGQIFAAPPAEPPQVVSMQSTLNTGSRPLPWALRFFTPFVLRINSPAAFFVGLVAVLILTLICACIPALLDYMLGGMRGVLDKADELCLSFGVIFAIVFCVVNSATFIIVYFIVKGHYARNTLQSQSGDLKVAKPGADESSRPGCIGRLVAVSFVVLLALLGIWFNLFVLFRIVARGYGTPTIAVVDRTHETTSTKYGSSFYIDYHYGLRGETHNDSQEVTRHDFSTTEPGKEVAARVMQFGGWTMCVVRVPNDNWMVVWFGLGLLCVDFLGAMVIVGSYRSWRSAARLRKSSVIRP